MTEYFSPKGTVIPVTILTAGPVTVTRIFSKDKDGYDSVQVGFRAQKKGKVSKGSAGAMKGAFYKTLKEFRLKPSDKSEVKEGDTIDVSIFAPGDLLQISSISKGKGFQGVVKRHHFGGVGMTTHGQSDRVRAPGSIGASSYPSRVMKGRRMAGRMGGDRVTVKNLMVLKVIAESNILIVKGSVPGAINSYLEIVKQS